MLRLGYAALVLLCCTGLGYAAENPRQISMIPPPKPVKPPPPPPPSPPLPNNTFYSPGLDFSFVIPTNITAFGNPEKSSLCAAVISGWAAPNNSPGAACAVGSVLPYDEARIVVSGYAYFYFDTLPTAQQNATVTALRDARVTALTSNLNSILGPLFPNSIPNCACYGLGNNVTQPSNVPYVYNIQVPGVPGPMVCGARLVYSNETTDPTSYLKVVGVDVGTGKYCSTPPIIGGVAGTPSPNGSCRQYGVLTQPLSSITATATATVSLGTVTAITMAKEGSGYTQIPRVVISPPNPAAAVPIATVSVATGSEGTLSISPTVATSSNGPYNGPVVISSYTGATCIDSSLTGTAVCTSTTASITVASTTYTGPSCLASELAPTGMPITAGVFVGPFSVNARIKCNAVPTLSLSTLNLQSPGTQANVSNVVISATGAVTSVAVAPGSTGYRTVPTVIIAPSAAYNVGKLCSPNPIASLSPTIAYSEEIEITKTGLCQPLGRDTYLNSTCSNTAPPQGISATLGFGTCNVQNSFLAQPNANTSSNCAIVPQLFVLTYPLSPPPPPFPPPLPPTPSPPAPPLPLPPAPTPKTCRWVGSYSIESVACPGKFIAFNNDPTINDGCSNSTLMLRTAEQSKTNKKIWQFNSIYTVGEVTVSSPIVAIGRIASCPKTLQTSLGANDFIPKPRLAGNGWEFNIIPVSATKSCTQVYLQLVGNSKYARKYVAHTDCNSQGAFAWAKASNSSTIKWQLKATK